MLKISEPKTQWGGDWTTKKLDAFEAYVRAYLNIMLKQKEKFKGWPFLIYYDGFAGSGVVSEKQDIDGKIEFPEFYLEKEVYRGSAERVLRLDKKFDEYYFVDVDKDAITQLSNLLTEKKLVNKNCHFINSDVNIHLSEFIKNWNKEKAALILLDPFGMQINWETIELFQNKRIDLWILLPSGVIINRFLNKKGDILYKERLEKYFGLRISELQQIFYATKSENTLFGEISKLEKIDNSIKKIAEIYVSKLGKIFKEVTKKPLELKNSKNVTIYHFVFASNNSKALKIAEQIIEKKKT